MSLMAEHSQIKLVEYLISFKALKQWDDRRDNPIPRDEMPQGSLNDQDFVMNAQTLINVSRKRLCNTSAKETRDAWQAVKDEIAKIEPDMAAVMVRNCIYRGFCLEPDCCGYCKTEKFKKELNDYRNLIGRGE